MSSSTTFSHSILVLELANLHDTHRFTSAISKATELTTDRLLIIIFCEAFNKDVNLSHTQSWPDVQAILTTVYVESTRIAQKANRILMDVDVLLRGLDSVVSLEKQDSWQHVFRTSKDETGYPLPDWVWKLTSTLLNVQEFPTTKANIGRNFTDGTGAANLTPSTFPVVALGGTFDHLHSGHKILLSMAAWIAHEKLIVGVTGDSLLQKKVHKGLLESLDTRITRTRNFLEFFKPGINYHVVPINDVYGPTAVDHYIQALVVSKETLGGASSIAKLREEREMPPLQCFVIDVISMTSSNLDAEDMEMLRQQKMSSTYIREWLAQNRTKSSQE